MKSRSSELQAAIDKNDMDGLKTKLDALEKAANDMAQQMYSQQAGTQQSAGNTSSTTSDKKDDDVIDADFKEKK